MTGWRRMAWQDCPLVPWRNGGGRTREVLAWPDAENWLVRVSVADIEADGPFSKFAGIERAFAVLEGAGVVLTLPQGDLRLDRSSKAALFAGEDAPMCQLVDGPTRDLNLMVRRHAGRPILQRQRTTGKPSRWRGLFTSDELSWTDDAAAPWPESPGGWWLSMEER